MIKGKSITELRKMIDEDKVNIEKEIVCYVEYLML